MSDLSSPATRAVWRWCVLYTLLAPVEGRERRREEMLSHLWESEQAQAPRRRVILASVRGVVQDVSWALACRLRRAPAAATTPGPYVALAAVSTLLGAFSSAILPRHHQWRGAPLELTGLLTAVGCLTVALVLAVRFARRNR